MIAPFFDSLFVFGGGTWCAIAAAATMATSLLLSCCASPTSLIGMLGVGAATEAAPDGTGGKEGAGDGGTAKGPDGVPIVAAEGVIGVPASL